jgi:hypothetical protein
MKTEKQIQEQLDKFYKESSEINEFLQKNILDDRDLFEDLDKRGKQCIDKYMALMWVLEKG